MIYETDTVMNYTSKIFLTKSILTYFSTVTCIESDDIYGYLYFYVSTAFLTWLA